MNYPEIKSMWPSPLAIMVLALMKNIVLKCSRFFNVLVIQKEWKVLVSVWPYVKKIVDDHGGVIIAKGKENEGATFTVVLPV